LSRAGWFENEPVLLTERLTLSVAMKL